MIQNFVNKFIAAEAQLKAKYMEDAPGSYEAIVKDIVEILAADEQYTYGLPDPDNIREIDDGDYQGTLLFLIASQGYQPSTYWVTKVSYGSCSGCDTLQSIDEDYRPWYSVEDDERSEKKRQAVDDYWTLALHLVQHMQEI